MASILGNLGSAFQKLAGSVSSALKNSGSGNKSSGSSSSSGSNKSSGSSSGGGSGYQTSIKNSPYYQNSGSSGGGGSSGSSGSTTTASRPAATQTTYLDPNGRKQTGYIINGQTYKDQGGNQRVDVGSTVQTGGGWYRLGADGKGVNAPNLNANSGSNPYQQLLNTGSTGNRPAATQTTYLDPQGNRQTGYIINGQTYKDQGGSQRVDTGSTVQTGGGWYRLGADGKGIKVEAPNLSGGQTGPVATQYYDPSGKSQVGYIINGQTYLDQAGTQRVGLGSIVKTGNGWYQMGPGGGVQVQAPVQTTYLDQNGQRHNAFLINGQTFLDPQGNQRIPVGSVVETAGGKYLMTENGGVPITDGELYQQQVNQMFQQRQAQQAEAINKATEAGVLEYQQLIPGINAQYDTAARQAYVNYMLEKQGLPEQMAKLGLSGQGISESTAARILNAYQGSLTESELARRAALQQVNQDIANLRAEGQARIAQGVADLGSEQFSAYQWLQQFLQQQNQWNQQQDWQKYIWNQQQSQGAAQEDYQRQLELAQTLAQYGDFSGYKAMGIDTSQMEQAWQQQQAMEAYQVYSRGTGTGGGSRGSSGGSRASGSKSSGSGSKSESTKTEKPGYSRLLSMMQDMDNPLSLSELASTYDINRTDYTSLAKEAEKMFDSDMEDILSGKLTYAQIRNSPYGRELTNRWMKLYGQEGYKELLQAAYETTGGQLAAAGAATNAIGTIPKLF